jgi:uncharacterized protein with von Willebrand factor type A (vWA) domain
MAAVQAVAAAGFTERGDFHAALRACLISRPEHRLVFDQAFRLFWRDPRFMDHMMGLIAPMVRGVQEERRAGAGARRAAEGLLHGADRADRREEPEAGAVIEIDAAGTVSAEERLRTLDFEQMSAAEMAAAKRVIAGLSLPVRPILSRRTEARAGRVPDWRGTLRAAVRGGGEVRAMATRRLRERWPNLIVICDISGSMSAYSRAVLQFVHAVANRKGQGWARVHAFTFGTRLTNITRHMAERDVDAALAAAGAEAQDWAGGTRIGACLAAFNRDWSRRVMGQGAVVILITDGLDRDPDAGLSAAMERLRLSARAVVWLNPLLRWEGFAPRAKGIAAMLPHVTSFRAGHNIAALEGLAAAIADPGDAGEKARMMAMLR